MALARALSARRRLRAVPLLDSADHVVKRGSALASLGTHGGTQALEVHVFVIATLVRGFPLGRRIGHLLAALALLRLALALVLAK